MGASAHPALVDNSDKMAGSNSSLVGTGNLLRKCKLEYAFDELADVEVP